jgi:hypothetical protein
VPSATSVAFRPALQIRHPAECRRFAQNSSAMALGRGERPTVPDSGRAMRKSDHVAHPQTSAERQAHRIRSTCDVTLAVDARTGTSFDGYEIVSAIGGAGWGQCSARAASGSGGNSRVTPARGARRVNRSGHNHLIVPAAVLWSETSSLGELDHAHRGTAIEPRSGWLYVLPSLTENRSRARGAESW